MATILVVDDEPDIVEILRLTLEIAGHRVVAAGDGEEALDRLARELPDAIVLDVGMPKVDGWAVLRQVKADPSAEVARVPVVMLTAWTGEEDRLRGGIEGAVRYLPKPFDPSEVVGVLDELLAPGAPPEPVVRRRVQQATLEHLARRERGETDGETGEETARVRLTRLERPRVAKPPPPGLTAAGLPGFLASLPPKQRAVVERLAKGASVRVVAAELGVSRSNVYAMLRRAARRAGLNDGRTLIQRLRRIGPATGGSP